jgi:asparagine synthase (glutamine-hydrolysing)
MDAKTYMPYDILTKVDVASMCHSLEVRTPLIDKEVWEFAATIPEEMNISRDANNHWEGKQLLKKLLEKQFPKEFVYRQKQGFGIPLSKWFSNEGQLRDKLNDSVLSKNSHISTFFNQDSLQQLLNSENTGGMWLMLFLEEWLTQFKK